MPTFEIKLKILESLEILDNDGLNAAVLTPYVFPSFLMTASRSGLSADRRRRRLRIGWSGALVIWYKFFKNSCFFSSDSVESYLSNNVFVSSIKQKDPFPSDAHGNRVQKRKHHLNHQRIEKFQ